MIYFQHTGFAGLELGIRNWGLWQYGLWSFQTRGIKLERFLPKNQHTQRKLLNFENWISMGLRSFQKSEFLKSIIYILPCTKLMNNEILEIFDFWNSDFWKLLRPMLIQFSKFNDFLWVCWFLGKNL